MIPNLELVALRLSCGTAAECQRMAEAMARINEPVVYVVVMAVTAAVLYKMYWVHQGSEANAE